MRAVLFAWIVSLSIIFGCGGSKEQSGKPDGGREEPSTEKEREGEARASLVKELERYGAEAVEATERRDWPRARQLIGRGLALVEKETAGHEREKARLLLKLGNVEREAGHETEARRYYTDAMAIFHVFKDARGRFDTYLALGQLEARRGDYVAASRQYDAAEGFLGEIDERRLPGRFKLVKGRLASRQVRHEDALKLYHEAFEIFEAARDKQMMAETLLLLALVDDAMGQRKPCRRRLDRALAIFRELGDLDGEARVLHRLAAHSARDEKYARARSLLKKVHEIYDRLDRTAAALEVQRHLNALPEK